MSTPIVIEGTTWFRRRTLSAPGPISVARAVTGDKGAPVIPSGSTS